MAATGPAHQKAAVDSVHFPLWRYNPYAEGKKLVKKIGQDKAMEMLKGAPL